MDATVIYLLSKTTGVPQLAYVRGNLKEHAWFPKYLHSCKKYLFHDLDEEVMQ